MQITDTSLATLIHRLGDKLQLTTAVKNHQQLLETIRLSLNTNQQQIAAKYNPVMPVQIEVFGPEEIAFLSNQKHPFQEKLVSMLINNKPKWIVFCGNTEIPDLFLQLTLKHRAIPLSSSRLSANNFIDMVNQTLATTDELGQNLHGVFMDVLGLGVLLTGTHNIGKSELALDLISRGHSLVADDSPEFFKTGESIIMGKSPRTLYEFLEVRGLGILNVRAMFGDNAVKNSVILKLIIHLEGKSGNDIDADHRLHGNIEKKEMFDTEVDCISLPVAPGRNLAVLVESAVRHYHLQTKGYNAATEFIKRQRLHMEENKE